MSAKNGDQVKVHYRGTLSDGTEFDNSFDKDPLEFTIGEGKIIPGFENAVEGMEEGEKKDFKISPDEGYGEYNDDGKIDVERANLPEDINPELGMMLQVTTPDNQEVQVTVVDMDENKITLDANHPLAGRDLYFEIQLMEVQPA